MKTFFILFAVLAVVLSVYPFLDQSEKSGSVSGLPWQIEIQPDGSTQVFGLHIGASRLADAYNILGNDTELAVIAATEEVGMLEMYYGHYQAGLLSGKLVLQTHASEQNIQRWRDNAVRSEYMASGLAKKYILSENDLTQAREEVITGLTFIPTVNLDESVVLARFGEPDRRIQLAGVTHYLYPAKGLDIALHENAKEVLQYIAPAAFQQLMQPLQQ